MKQKTYFQSVHVLRGVAALMVVCDHLLGHVPGLAWLDSGGELGVVCFFVISGFAISHSLGDEYQVRELPRFFIRRLVRIEPTYFASVAIHCAFFMALTRFAPRAIPWSPTDGQLLSHALYLVPFTGEEWLVPAYWSLAVEFQFYLVIGFLYPALLLIERRWPNGVALSMILFASLAFLSPFCPNARVLEFSPFFALGVLSARHMSMPRDQGLLWIAALVISAMTLLAESGTGTLPACVGLITFAIICLWRTDLCSTNRLVRVGLFFGTISYSWYAIHTTIGMAGDTGARILSRLGAFPLQRLLIDLVPVATFAASILAAWLLYIAIERPTHRLARRIALRADRRP